MLLVTQENDFDLGSVSQGIYRHLTFLTDKRLILCQNALCWKKSRV